MIDIKNYKHIIWDWNGTLFNDVELCRNIISGILKRRNLPELTLDTYRNIFTFPVKEYYKSAGLDVSGDNWEILSHEFMNEYEARKYECVLYDSAFEVLDKIHSAGPDQSVLSAYSQHTLEEIIDSFNLSGFFVGLIGLDNIYAAGKVESGIKWMKELGHSHGEVMLIGDTVHDFEVAREIGADCLLIAEGHQDKSRLSEVTGDILNTLSDLKINP
jgi:phosphoglycolate phosphatase